MDTQEIIESALFDASVIIALGCSLAVAGAVAALIAWAVITHENK